MNDTLFQAEQRREHVIVIAHQEPKNFYDHFAQSYNQLIRRYRATITGLFYGHTHWQSLNIYTDNSTSPVTNTHVGYIGGSLTPYTQYGPGFTVYNYNRSLSSPYIVEEMSQYWIDLDDVNTRPLQQPNWTSQRIASKDYGLSDLSPSSWSRLATAFTRNLTYSTFQSYYNALMKGHPGPVSQWDSIQSVGCSMLSTTNDQYSQCMQTAIGVSGLSAPKSSCDATAHRSTQSLGPCPPMKAMTANA